MDFLDISNIKGAPGNAKRREKKKGVVRGENAKKTLKKTLKSCILIAFSLEYAEDTRAIRRSV